MKNKPHYLASTVLFSVCLNLSWQAIVFAADAGDWETKKQELDAECEAAREVHLSVDRTQYIEECVAKKQKENRAACERFYSDYGSQSGSRPAMYYDLPECERAFEHRQSQRNRDSRKQ
jgi:hypothetical protein